jgi:hypothetical protein
MINIIKNNRQTINRLASFQQVNQQQVKIKLPESPKTIIKNQYKPAVIPENIVVRETPKESQLDVNDLLHFIDEDKLLDVKQSKKVNVYELYQLKDLAKKIGVNFSNVNKGALIERIKDKLNNQFHGQPNLIGYLKQLKDKDLTLVNIGKAFDFYHISNDKKTELLEKIKKIIHVKDTIQFIIQILEQTWLVPKLKG